MYVTHLRHSSDRAYALNLIIMMLGTVTPTPADVGLNLDDKG